MRTLNAYLEYRLKSAEEQTLFEVFVAEHLSVISTGKRLSERTSYVDKRNELWGISRVKDDRTAEQIIEDTFKKHGLKIKRR